MVVVKEVSVAVPTNVSANFRLIFTDEQGKEASFSISPEQLRVLTSLLVKVTPEKMFPVSGLASYVRKPVQEFSNNDHFQQYETER